MRKGSKKSPIQKTPRTKEQIERDIEVARKRKLIVEQFYPALVEATISVDEAKMLVQAMSSFLMEDVLATMKERKFSDISQRMLKKLTPEGERLLVIEKLLDVFKGENLFTAREIIEGMVRAIDHTIGTEMRGRKLDTLNPDWNVMLN